MVSRNEGTRHGNPAPGVDNDPTLNSFLDGIRDAGMAVTNSWKDLWFTGIEYAWGRHFKDWKLKEEWQYIVVNRIYPLMFQTIAKLAGNNPKILTHAWNDEKEGTTSYAEKWAGHLDYLWKSPYELNMRLKLVKGLLDCAVFGYMVGEPYWEAKPRSGWDNDKKEWVGKVGMRFIHPAMFWCDPSADTIDNAENCGTKRRVKMEWAQNKWPEFKDEIKAESFTAQDPEYVAGDAIVYKNQKADKLSLSRKNMFSRIVDLIINSGATDGNTIQPEQTASDQKYVNIEKIFWRDYTEKTVKIEEPISAETLISQGLAVAEEVTGLLLDPKTNKPIEKDDYPTEVTNEYKEPLYPNGRFVLRIGNTILNPQTAEDKKIHKDFTADQVHKESRWPFYVMPYHILPHMWQGNNAVEMVRNNNDMLNMTISSMLQQVRRAADPTKVIEAGALARGRNGKIRNQRDGITKLGRIIVAAKGKLDKIRDWVYQPLDPAVPALAAVLKQDIDDNMFMQDVARGAATKGQQTKAEIQRLNANSLDYTAMQGIFLDKFIDDVMTQIAEIAQSHYDIGRLMKMLFDEVKEGANVDQAILDVRFDVNIEPGSTLPFDEQKKQQEYAAAYNLLENPIPNPMIEDMLRILNISKRKEILSKYQGLQLFRQFIQLGQMLLQAQAASAEAGTGEFEKILERMKLIPGMEQLIDILLKVGQLAPQMKV